MYGMALYEGVDGVERDCECAQMWLSRAIKQIFKEAGCLIGSENDGPAQEAESELCGAVSQSCASVQPQDVSVSDPMKRDVLSKACLVLGYIHFDGDASLSNKEEAVRMFKVAARYSSQEAAEVLGWIFNTGQYG